MSEIPINKNCLKCGTSKHNLFFHKKKSSHDGLNSWCIDCRKHESIKRKLASGKRCISCEAVKPKEYFHENIHNKDNHHNECKACVNAKEMHRSTWRADPVDFERIAQHFGICTVLMTDSEKIILWNDQTNMTLPRMSDRGKNLQVLCD